MGVVACGPDDIFIVEVTKPARHLAQLPIESLIATKALLMEPRRTAMKKANLAEKAALARLRGGPANIEALNAFRETREPNFSSNLTNRAPGQQ